MAGRVVLITGAGKGIGRAAAVAFARQRDAVSLVTRSEGPGRETLEYVHQQGAPGIFILADISTSEGARRAIQETVAQLGRLDVLVNNAGIYRQGDILSTSELAWEEVLRTNLTGAFLCAKYAVEHMISQGGGVIVNVASEAGLVGIPGQVAYNVSKAGMIMLTKSLAVDLARHGIRANCVCPGTTDTPLVREAVARSHDPEGARRRLESARPLNRLGAPEEIAEAIVFLASERCAYATGAILAVDGGYTAQ